MKKGNALPLVLGLVAVVVVLALVAYLALAGGASSSASGKGEVGERVVAQTPDRSGEAAVTVRGVEWGTRDGRSVVTVGVEMTSLRGRVGNNGVYCTTKSGRRVLDSGAKREPHWPSNFMLDQGDSALGLLAFEFDQPEECELGFNLAKPWTRIRIPATNAGGSLTLLPPSPGVPQASIGKPFEYSPDPTEGPGKSTAQVTVTRLAWRDAGHLEISLTAVGVAGQNMIRGRLTSGGVVAMTDTGKQVMLMGQPDLNDANPLKPGERMTATLTGSIPRGTGRVEFVTFHRAAAYLPLPA